VEVIVKFAAGVNGIPVSTVVALAQPAIVLEPVLKN
jgi:hypothetical protein